MTPARIAGDRGIDHLVLCVRDLDAARAFYARLGFTCTPRAVHPWGTANSLVQFQGNFLELLAVDDPAKIARPAPGAFSFGWFNAEFLKRREGMSQLVFQSRDARADQARFRAAGLDTYPPFDFERQAKLPDGSSARVAFSLAFVTHKAMPEAAFFCCQQHAPQYFWKPEYQRHANGARAVSEVVMRAPDPAALAGFFARLQGEDGVAASPGGLTVRTALGTLLVLGADALTERLPEMNLPGPADSPVFVAYRVAVADVDRAEKLLRGNGVPYRRHRGALIIDPIGASGVAIELAEAS
ncbi:MAG: VOC family protein [Alphaproteobacteria bacterium]|nr:VOC family protein [Alphaproteobacteria bacterium]